MKKENTKEEIIEALKDEKVLRCPYCNHKVFIRKEFTKVEIIKDREGIRDEEVEVLFDEYEYRCVKCDKDVLIEELK